MDAGGIYFGFHLLDAFEAEAILVLTKTASERHVVAFESQDIAPQAHVPTDLGPKLGDDPSAAVHLFGVERPAQSHSAVLLQAFDFGLA